MAPASFDLTGRVAVVVGGTSGIGRTLALGLADAGADVVADRAACRISSAAVADDNRSEGPPVTAGRVRRRRHRVARARRATRACGIRRDRHRRRRGRHDQTGAVAGDVRRRLGHDHRDESHRDVPFVPGVRGADGRARIGPRDHDRARSRRSSGCSKWRRTRRARPGVAGLTRALAVEWAPARRDGQRDRARACSGPISIARCSTRHAGRSS